MRRSGPIQRKTPLKVKKRMERGKGLPQSKPLGKGQAIRAKRATPRRRDRSDPDHGQPWAEVRLVIFGRALGRCEICGTGLTMVSMEAHHRRTRKVGPDCVGNALALCRSCHHDEVHGQPEVAMDLGWIVSRHADAPCQRPVEIRGRGLVVLTCGGAYVDAPETHG